MNPDVAFPGGRQICATRAVGGDMAVDTYVYSNLVDAAPSVFLDDCYLEQWTMMDGKTLERQIMFLRPEDIIAFGEAMKKEMERLRANGSAQGSTVAPDQ